MIQNAFVMMMMVIRVVVDGVVVFVVNVVVLKFFDVPNSY
jgi:hypothetical protein